MSEIKPRPTYVHCETRIMYTITTITRVKYIVFIVDLLDSLLPLNLIKFANDRKRYTGSIRGFLHAEDSLFTFLLITLFIYY